MRNSGLRIHQKLLGRVDLAARWLPFAKNKLVDLIDQSQRTGARFLSKTLRPNGNVFIWVQLAGGEKFITIEVKEGCRDLRGFILQREGPAGNQTYSAFYNDGLVEVINPITGTPRPDPDPAVRTKGYKVVSALLQGAFSGVPASKFSGHMRKVVGCYHVGGRNAPFSHTWATTHGIFKHTTQAPGKDPVDRFYIVEVSSLGVFAAPISDTGKCCDSWGVSRYQPNTEELADNPQWQIYKTTLSLWWAKTHGLRPGVLTLISGPGMAQPYALGSPWYEGHGWAFSASGAKIRAITQRGEALPDDHYVCNQWEIALVVNSNGDPTATLTQLDSEKAFTPLITDPLWVPSSAGTWGGVSAFPPGGTQVDQFPVQDAPVFVYFDGEVAIETRWSLTKEEVPAFTTPPIAVTGGGTLNWDNLLVANLDPSVPLFSCDDPLETKVTFPDKLLGGEGVNDPAYTRLTAGYKSPRVTRVETRHVFQRRVFATIVEDRPDIVTNFINTYTLHPDCYYIDPDTGTLVTICQSRILRTDRIKRAFSDDQTFDETKAANVGFVMFAQEREAALTVWQNSLDQSGTRDVGGTQRGDFRFQRREEKTAIPSDPNPNCPFTTTEEEFINNPFGGPWFTEFADVVDNFSISGAAQLDIGADAYTATASFGPPPFFAWDNFNLGTFLEFNGVTKPTAESNVFAMHGNLYYDEPSLVPPQQRSNAVYNLDNDLVAVGGFTEPTGEVLGFVGRA